MNKDEKPEDVSTSEFNAFNNDVAKVTNDFNKMNKLSTFINEVKKDSEKSAFIGIGTANTNISAEVKEMFPKLLKDVESIDNKDDVFKELEAKLKDLENAYKTSTQNFFQRSKRNPEFMKRFKQLQSSGIVPLGS